MTKTICRIFVWLFGIGSFVLFIGTFILSISGYSGPSPDEPGVNYAVRTACWSLVFAGIAGLSYLPLKLKESN